ncbi:hypothetical protein V498_08410 [Pseudogymnoascus sp. VKM F-4517 (FW-2822)]|nr:hypothetical protein V498_08410 [Pseudogymnoascus sp. VKM F-4517 (FW-2822)]
MRSPSPPFQSPARSVSVSTPPTTRLHGSETELRRARARAAREEKEGSPKKKKRCLGSEGLRKPKIRCGIGMSGRHSLAQHRTVQYSTPHLTSPPSPHLTQGAKLPSPARATHQCLGAVSQRARPSASHAPEDSHFPAAIPDCAARAPEPSGWLGSISAVMGGAMRPGFVAPAAAGCAEEVQRRSWRAVERSGGARDGAGSDVVWVGRREEAVVFLRVRVRGIGRSVGCCTVP